MTTWPASNLPDEAQAWRRKVEELLEDTQRAGRITRTNQIAASQGQTSLARTLASANLSIEEQAAAIVQSGKVPAPPENPSVTSDTYFDEYGVPRATVFASCDPVVLDIDGLDISVTKFELHGRPNTADGAWQKLAETQVVDIPTITYSPLPAGEEWAFRLHAVSDAGVLGNPSAEVVITLAKDTTPPPQPAAPTGESRLGQVTISTTGLTFDGQAQPADFAYFDVLMAATLSGAGTSVGRMEGAGPNALHVADQPYNVEQWYWLVGVDVAGNRSVDSDRIPGTAVPVADTDVSDELLEGITDAVTQSVSTNLGNTITWATVAPVAADGSGKPVGHLWYQKDGGNTIIGAWEWDGAAWQPRQFDDATLANLDAGKINTGFLDAARIAASTITADKLLVGDFTNAFNSPYIQTGVGVAGIGSVYSGGEASPTGGRLLILAGRDHFANADLRVRALPGDEYYVEVVAKRIAGTANLNPRMAAWTDGGGTPAGMLGPWNTPTTLATTQVEDLGGGWFRLVGASRIPPTATDAAWAGLWLQIDQGAPYGTQWLVTDIRARKRAAGSLLVDGSITGLQVAANAITANELAANAVTAGKINAGAIDGMVITGPTIRTAASGQRVQLDTGGLKAYNSANAVTGQLSASSGGLTLSGTLRSGSGNQRAELYSNGLRFYESGGALSGDITGYSPVPGSSANSLIYIKAGTGSYGITVGKQEASGGGTQVDLTATGAEFNYLKVRELVTYGITANFLEATGSVTAPNLPFATATGRLTGVSVAAAGLTSTAVTFPAGRFTVAPIVNVTQVGSDYRDIMVGATSVTATGMTVWRGSAYTPGIARSGVLAEWTATQMKSTAAAG